jgi:5'-3' exonuclease
MSHLRRRGNKKYEVIPLIDGGILYQLTVVLDNVQDKKEVKAKIENYFNDNIFSRITGFEGRYMLILDSKKNFRKEKYADYKANRDNRELPKWLHYAKELVKPYAVEFESLEADDGIALVHTYNEYLFNKGHIDYRTCIVSGDKDLIQLGGHIFRPSRKYKGIEKANTFAFIEEEQANRYFWLQMIMGDSVDNIKGIVGLGEKGGDDMFDAMEDIVVNANNIVDNIITIIKKSKRAKLDMSEIYEYLVKYLYKNADDEYAKNYELLRLKTNYKDFELPEFTNKSFLNG